MANRLVSHGVLSQIVADHIGFDFDGVPVLSTIDINLGVAHLWDNDAISEMGLDSLWLLTRNLGSLGLSEFLDKSFILSLDATAVSPLLSRVHELDDFIGTHLKQLIQLVSSINLLLEWFLLWYDSLRHF